MTVLVVVSDEERRKKQHENSLGKSTNVDAQLAGVHYRGWPNTSGVSLPKSLLRQNTFS